MGFLRAAPGLSLPVLMRPPSRQSVDARRIYISTGIHGDEPAGPLAVASLLRGDALPAEAWLYCCPCLNPTGFPRNTRAAASGLDLNRDYRHLQSPEIRAHVEWLQQQPAFDVAFCLHEDWEASGFYLYELNPDGLRSIATDIVDGVRPVCPIDPSPLIDGREAIDGIISPRIDPALRPEWPEALYLVDQKTRLSYTLESPSDFELPERVEALERGVMAGLAGFLR